MMINKLKLAKPLSFVFTFTLACTALAAQLSPWDDDFNVYKYFKKSDGTCLYNKKDCSALTQHSVTQFKKVDHFNGGVFGLNQQFSVDINGDGIKESVPKYSGNLSTYTAKHYPTAVKHSNNLVYFTYSGPVKLDGSDTYASTAGEGQTTTPSQFFDSRGKSRALGIYLAQYNPAIDKVSEPVLIHAKYTDDPHDNAVVNIDDEGYIYVLVAGRGQRRGAFLYKSTLPGAIDSFSDISPDNVDYTNFNSGFDHIGIAYPKMFWINSDGGYFRLIYTVYCNSPACGQRNIFSAKLNINGTTKATLTQIDRIAGFKGHYSIANARGNDIVVAFNVHLNNSVDHRTNLYYMHSNDGGASWNNANNSPVTIPMLTQASLDQVTAREYYHEGQTVKRRIYIKDINFSGTGNNKKPMILYVGAIGTNSYIPNTTVDHYLAKAFHDGTKWTQARLSNDVDHNYSSGMLVSDNSDTYDIYFPATAQNENNALGGGAVAKTVTLGDSKTQYNLTYMTQPKAQTDYASNTEYFNRMCEFNYIRAIHSNDSKSGVVGIAAAGNPYRYALESSASPLFIVKHNEVRMLPHNFSVNEVSNGYIETIANPHHACDPNRNI